MLSIKKFKNKNNLKILINNSIKFLENKKFESALSCINKIKKNYVFPDINFYYSLIYLYYANEYYVNKKYRQALILYLKAEKFSCNLDSKFLNEIYIKLGSCYQYLNNYENAKNIYAKLIKQDKKPDISYGFLLYSMLCSGDWKGIEILMEKIFEKLKSGTSSITPFTSILVSENPDFQYMASKNFSSRFLNKPSKFNVNFKNNLKHKKIKIAYLSSDFYNHATSHLISEMFQQQNNEKFNYYAFSYGKTDNSDISNKVKSSFNQFFIVNDKTDEQISKLLIENEIDIAVDLKGHTKDNRLKILSKKPCPIQISFLGFPGTLGTDFIDYLIMDKYIINKFNREFFSEHIIYMPNSYQCNQIIKTKKANKKNYNLPNDKLILCSLNNSQKYNPALLKVWGDILLENPNTILWLLDDNEAIKQNIINYFKNNNIHSSRILFANKVDTKTHISRMSLADIFLDSYPCNAHTTASDSLQANLPIITMSGTSMSSRVSGSLLNTLELSELICSNFDEYKEKVNYFLNNKYKLEAVRNKISQNKYKKLFNSKLFVNDIENAYQKVWENYLNGNKIADIFI